VAIALVPEKGSCSRASHPVGDGSGATEFARKILNMQPARTQASTIPGDCAWDFMVEVMIPPKSPNECRDAGNGDRMAGSSIPRRCERRARWECFPGISHRLR